MTTERRRRRRRRRRTLRRNGLGRSIVSVQSPVAPSSYVFVPKIAARLAIGKFIRNRKCAIYKHRLQTSTLLYTNQKERKKERKS